MFWPGTSIPNGLIMKSALNSFKAVLTFGWKQTFLLPKFMNETDNIDQPKKDIEFLKDNVARMMEHFDSVQVFATKVDSENKDTKMYECGRGNWFSRFGVVSLWFKTEQDKGL